MHLAESLHHVAIAVHDLAASIAWYREKLDFRVEKRFTLPEANLEIVKLISGGVRVELLKHHGDLDTPRAEKTLTAPGAQHFCFHVTDLEATVHELRRRGVVFIQESKVIQASAEKNCWIADGEGNLIEFIEELED